MGRRLTLHSPSHVIKMLPPRRIVSPFFATFQVPLRFNKLDLRDYLYHAYGVEVRNVRSWLTPQLPRRRFSNGGSTGLGGSDDIDIRDVKSSGRGPWYRPQPIKRMMVELVKPFAFPAAPAEPTEAQRGTDDDPRAGWDYDMHRRLTLQQKSQEKGHDQRVHEKQFTLRDEEEHVPAFRVGLAKQARELVRGERAWRTTAKLDDRWDEAEKKGGAKTTSPQ